MFNAENFIRRLFLSGTRRFVPRLCSMEFDVSYYGAGVGSSAWR